MQETQTLEKIESLNIEPRPLVICDVDEVVVQFVAAFERHLMHRGFWLDVQNFALFGNVRRRADGTLVDDAEVRDLVRAFFAAEAGRLDLVPGAVETLDVLRRSAQIVLLTNIPDNYLEARLSNLRGHGLHDPVVANQGPKGPAVAALCARLNAPVFFIDDSPSNIRSVISEAPHCHVIHFMADERYLKIAEPIEGIRLKTGHWSEAQSYIQEMIAVEFASPPE